MSILIKGMEMPKSCWVCKLCFCGYKCEATGESTMTLPIDAKLDTCPLVEVKHGRWELKTSPTHHHIGYQHCSVCGCPQLEATPFCPNCGADMRKTDEEESKTDTTE